MPHILTVNISALSSGEYQQLYAQVDNRRRRQADRYLRQEDRLRCVVAGALLRYAVYHSMGKREFEVESTPLGKPQLKDEPHFHYNLSHSGHWVVIAYDDQPIGIDVEQISWDSGKENIARRYFTQDEQEFVFAQTWQGRAERFFQIWTAKESYLKYLGEGLRKPLDSFSVLQILMPKRYSFQPEEGYSMTLWSADDNYTMEQLSIEQLLEPME